MDLTKTIEKLKIKTLNLYSNEKRIEAELKILAVKKLPEELQRFLQWAFVENQIAVDNIDKIMTHLTVVPMQTDDAVLDTTFTELNSTLHTHVQDEKAIRNTLSIYYHTIAGYQVKTFTKALSTAVEAEDFYSSQFLSQCLNNKVEIKNAIQLLENKFVHRTTSAKTKTAESIPAYL